MGIPRTRDWFVAKATALHGNKFNYEKTVYSGYFIKCEIQCCQCQKTFSQTPSNHLAGCGCKFCAYSIDRLSTFRFLEMAQEVHGDTYDYSNTTYFNAKTKVSIKCKKCDLAFLQLPRSHLYEESGCPSCRRSHGENKIALILKLANIDFIPQHRFDGCRGKRNRLPFDFYLPKFNICIEFDGRQHWDESSKFWNIQIKINDQIKNSFCKSNGIILKRITDEDLNNIENILRNIIC